MDQQVDAATGTATSVLPSPPARRAPRIDPYWILCGVLVVLLIVQTLNQRFSTDFWIHKATLDGFRDNLLHPRNPLTGTDADFEYYSPYMFVLAVIGRVTGLSSIVVLQVAGVLNLALFLVGFRLFVRALTGRLATTFALIAALVFWGWHPWRWSGLLNLNSIGFGLPYPSMFATGLALVVAWALLRYDATRNAWWLAAVAVGLPVVMLSHPFTGLWTCVVLLTLVIHARLYRRGTRVPLALVGVVVLALLALWPYYRFFELLGSSGQFGGSALYDQVALRLCAVAVGVVPIWRRWRADRTDPLALMFVAGALMYLAGTITSDNNYGRFLPLALLPLQIGIGELVAGFIEIPASRSRALIGWVAVSGVIGLAGTAGAFASMVPRDLLPASLRDRSSLESITQQYAGLDGALPRGSVVVVETEDMEGTVAAFGLHPLSIEPAGAFVADAAERQTASGQILDRATSPEQRNELLEKYQVQGVMCLSQSCRSLFRGRDVRVKDAQLIVLKP